MPHVKPLAIVQEGGNELTAAAWDEELKAWEADDGRMFEGPEPNEADEVIVAQEQKSSLVDRLRLSGRSAWPTDSDQQSEGSE